MDNYAKKLGKYIKEANIQCEHMYFQESCHSVEDAMKAADAKREDFIKNICLIDPKKKLIVTIIKGEDKVDITALEKLLNVKQIRTAKPEEILEKTGYPCGGVPSFGYTASFLIDPRVMEKETIYTGGGSQTSLIKISPIILKNANNGKIIRIRK